MDLNDYKHALITDGKSKGTIEQRVGDIRRFTTTVNDLLACDSEDLLRYLSPERGAPAYIRKIRSSFKSFYGWAFRTGLIDENPTADLPPFRIPRRAPLPPAPGKVIVRAFELGNLHQRAIVALAGTMGLRRSEIASLHPSNRTGTELRVTGKGGHARVLPLDDVTMKVLELLEFEQGEDTHYFPGRFGGHAHPATIYKHAKRLLNDWSLHSCRRRAATDGYKANPNIYALRDFLGHASIYTSEYYVVPNMTDIEAMVRGTSLGFSTHARHIAGLPTAERIDVDEKTRLLADLADITARAREFGLELVLR